ncbi:MAG TPA: hypothetical protein VEK34_11765 [Methylocella sp.]|nr:hypothetical protein [Methylocella sp.]
MVLPKSPAALLGALLLSALPAAAQQFGPGTAGEPSNNDTTWVSICPPGTTVVSGSCFTPGGEDHALRSAGINTANNAWECVWTKSTPKANVHALCSKTQ